MTLMPNILPRTKDEATPGESRVSWQRKRWSPVTVRRVRIGVGLLVAVALTGWVAYLYWKPFRHPEIHVGVLSASYSEDLSPAELPHVLPLPNATELPGAVNEWARQTGLPPAVDLSALSAGTTLSCLEAAFSADTVDEGDVAICLIQAHVVADENTVAFVDRLNPTNPQQGRVELADFCRVLSASPAGLKLLCIDAGSVTSDPRVGIVANNFAAALQQAVEATRDSELWVFVSHTSGQRSHADNQHRPTVFLDALLRGFHGECDVNSDQRVELSELLPFVRDEVARWQRKHELPANTQTPWLICGGGEFVERDLNVVLLPILDKGRKKKLARFQAEADAKAAKEREANGDVEPTDIAATSAGDIANKPAVQQGAVTAEESKTPVEPPAVTTMTNEELLAEAWRRRDKQVDRTAADNAAEVAPATGMLNARQALLIPRGRAAAPWEYAEHAWQQCEFELLQADRLWRSQPQQFPRRIRHWLQARVVDLRELQAGHVTSITPGGTAWLRRVRALQPVAPDAPSTRLSLALMRRWAHWYQQPLGAKVEQEWAAVNRCLQADDRSVWEEVAKSETRATSAELRLAIGLTVRTEYPLEVLQLALSTRCFGEELAANPTTVRWLGKELAAATHSRLVAEYDLVRPLTPPHALRAQQTLRETLADYQSIDLITHRLERASRLQRELLRELPAWMEFSRRTSSETSSALARELKPLLRDLATLIELLASADSGECGRIEQLRQALTTQRQRVADVVLAIDFEVLAFAVDPFQGEQLLLANALLDSRLLTETQRQQLTEFLNRPLKHHIHSDAVANDTQQTLAKSQPVATPLRRVSDDDIVQQTTVVDAELEWLYARLQQPLRQRDASNQKSPWELEPFTFLETQSDRDAESESELEFRYPVNDVIGRNTLETFYAAFPGRLRKYADNPVMQADRTQKLDPTWRHALSLVDPRDELPMSVEARTERNMLAAHADVIVWQWQQAVAALAQVTDAIRALHTARAETLRRILVNDFGRQTPPLPRPVLRILGPGVLDLREDAGQDLLLEVVNTSTTTRRVRYEIDYDPQLVTVRTPGVECVHRPFAGVGRDSRTPEHAESRNGASVGIALESQRQQRFLLEVTGRAAAGNTRLVVDAICDGMSSRREILIDLPPLPLAGLAVVSEEHQKEFSKQSLQLQPLPNRTASYGFSLIGTREAPTQAATVSLYRIAALDTQLPATQTLGNAQLTRWLGGQPDIHLVSRLPEVSLPSIGTSLPLVLPDLPVDSAIHREMSGGLLIVLQDRQHDQATWYHVPCTPLRPEAVVTPQVGFDAERQQLRIRVRPHNSINLPTDGLAIHCRVATRSENMANNRESWLIDDGLDVTRILPGNGNAVDFKLSIPRETGKQRRVTIDVDGWPRAFVYRVPVGFTQENVPPADDVFATEIVSPQVRSAVRAPVNNVPVTVAASVSRMFVPGRDFLQVGLDLNGDRLLRGETSLRLPSDRQTRVFLESIGPAGSINLRNAVTDWRVHVPARGVRDREVAVIARLVQGPQETWSPGVPIVFDATGPQLQHPKLMPGSEPEIGQPLQITVAAGDNGLSGVAGVAAALDGNGLGLLDPKLVWEPAQLAANGQWTVTMATKKWEPGPRSILLRATDRAGNAGPLRLVTVNALTPAQQAAKLAARTVRLLGNVTLANRPAGDTKIALTLQPAESATDGETVASIRVDPLSTTTNRDGQFAFAAVPGGKYELEATVVIRGYRYRAVREIEINPETPPAPLTLELQPAPAK